MFVTCDFSYSSFCKIFSSSQIPSASCRNDIEGVRENKNTLRWHLANWEIVLDLSGKTIKANAPTKVYKSKTQKISYCNWDIIYVVAEK